VYQFRPFRNSDPPRLAEIWRQQPPQRGVMQPMTASLLEQNVFSKPYFEPEGLIVALDGQVPVGFVHAGFGPNAEQTAIDTDVGTTYQLMLQAEQRENGLPDELLAHAEGYLRERGARVLYAGGVRPLNGFYLGLYGGSELPGVLASDMVLNAAAIRSGYREIDRVVVLQLELAGYRPAISRDQRRLRRELMFTESGNPPHATWWDACTMGAFERVQFSLAAPGSQQSLASVSFWDIEPLSSTWAVPMSGMIELEVSLTRRRQGLATYLLGEAFERLRNRGVLRVECQTMCQNAPALALYEKLGFTRVDEGIVYRKAK
jgi:ribosomal protein S18 acetylase RimI-like enzyme